MQLAPISSVPPRNDIFMIHIVTETRREANGRGRKGVGPYGALKSAPPQDGFPVYSAPADPSDKGHEEGAFYGHSALYQVRFIGFLSRGV